MLSLIDRWLLKEVVRALLVILAVLFTVLLAGLMVRMLGKVAAGVLGNDMLLILVGLEMLTNLGLLLPPAFFFAVLWVLGQLYRNGEMLALQAAGVGTLRIYRAFLYSAVPLALLLGWLTLELLPWVKMTSESILLREKARTELTAIRPGEFNEFSNGDLVVFAAGSDLNGAPRDLFIQDRLQGGQAIVTAAGARQRSDPDSGADYVVLLNGRRYEGLAGERPVAVAEFAEYAFRVPRVELDPADLRLSARDWRQLRASERPAHQAELQYRLSLPLSILAFTLVAVPLARSMPRQGIYGRLGMAVLVYLLYMNLQQLGVRWLAQGVTPAWLGMWWVPALLATVALLVLSFDSPRWRVWLRRRRAAA